MDDRRAELDERETDLDQRCSEPDERDKALTATEKEIEENTIPGSGIYLVGDDIKPGTYRSEGSRCYWARLSGTSGELEHIIANENVGVPPISPLPPPTLPLKPHVAENGRCSNRYISLQPLGS